MIARIAQRNNILWFRFDGISFAIDFTIRETMRMILRSITKNSDLESKKSVKDLLIKPICSFLATQNNHFGQMRISYLRVVLFGLFLNITLTSLGQNIEVTVRGIKNDNGNLMIGLFNSEKTFTKKVFRAESPKAIKGKLKVIFKNVPAGDYAISVFHDENGNEKIDTNIVGMPKEGFGFSNDAMGTFGPPSFEKAKVVVPKVKSIVIKLKYF